MSAQPTAEHAQAEPAGWWRTLFDDQEAAAYQAQSGEPSRLGRRPALLVVDVVRAFTGQAGLSLVDSIRQWPTSCGPAAWQAMPHLRRLVEHADHHDWPIIYTTGDPGSAAWYGGTVKGQGGRLADLMDRPGAQDIPDQLTPPPGALVLRKPKASAFFSTPLLAHLVRQGVDHLVVAGTTTSGCVRATVVDGHSHGYPVWLVEQASFDRARLSHGVSLYEMNAKYADVVDLDTLLATGRSQPHGACVPDHAKP